MAGTLHYVTIGALDGLDSRFVDSMNCLHGSGLPARAYPNYWKSFLFLHRHSLFLASGDQTTFMVVFYGLFSVIDPCWYVHWLGMTSELLVTSNLALGVFEFYSGLSDGRAYPKEFERKKQASYTGMVRRNHGSF